MITNIFIEDILFKISNLFKGCFSSDNIPTSLQFHDKFAIICNLSTAISPGSHFVVIIYDKNKIMYIDPLGLNSFIPTISNFLLRFNVPIFVNTNQIQSRNSSFCGFFCILFVIAYEKNVLNDLRFYVKNLSQNDELCIKYLEEIITHV